MTAHQMYNLHIQLRVSKRPQLVEVHLQNTVWGNPRTHEINHLYTQVFLVILWTSKKLIFSNIA